MSSAPTEELVWEHDARGRRWVESPGGQGPADTSFQGLTVQLQICEPIQCSLINHPAKEQNAWAARLSPEIPTNTNVSK